jgi:hypothetical protein
MSDRSISNRRKASVERLLCEPLDSDSFDLSPGKWRQILGDQRNVDRDSDSTPLDPSNLPGKDQVVLLYYLLIGLLFLTWLLYLLLPLP